MAYMALYRKFRPESFAEVKGQDAIVTTLTNQIKAGRIGHAYLFCGTRGTGKTTVAKILAKAVNCEHPVDGNPCGECASCRAIAEGSSLNVIEIDAASNNGVDNIREIREEVSYSPTEGKYKVYIIDEAHMLSIGAFNALLKTLEEPPSYVIFILATTEAHKIPVTIMSRCQRYDFKRISIDTITARLTDLMEREGVEAEEQALRYIARTADGSMRDALSLLDQCIAFYLGEKVTYDHALEVLGAVDISIFRKLLKAVTGGDVDACLKLMDEVIVQGRDLTQFTTDFTWYLRNLLLIISAEHPEEILEVTSENLAYLKEDAALTNPEQLFRFIRIFSELNNQIRFATQKRVLMEVTLIKLCRPSMEADTESLAERVRVLEKTIEEGNFPVGNAEAAPSRAAGEPVAFKKPKPELPMAVPEDVKNIVSKYRVLVGDMEQLWQSAFEGTKLTLSHNGNLLIVFPNEGGLTIMDRRRDQLEEFLSGKIGKQVRVELTALKKNEKFENAFVDLEDKIKMPIEVEDLPKDR